MINPSKLLKMARKWQRLATIKGRRILFPITTRDVDTNNCSSTSTVADKGHFVVYTIDRRRFAVPLVCLGSEVFREPLKMSEGEFGISGERPILLPSDSLLMEYIFSLIRRGVPRDLQKGFAHALASQLEQHDQSQQTSQDGKEMAELAVMKGKRISFPRTSRDADTNSCSTSTVADREHFVVYTTDQTRFAVPLVYLDDEVFRELLKMSEEEFGFSTEGPIVLPRDTFFVEYIV